MLLNIFYVFWQPYKLFASIIGSVIAHDWFAGSIANCSLLFAVMCTIK